MIKRFELETGELLVVDFSNFGLCVNTAQKFGSDFGTALIEFTEKAVIKSECKNIDFSTDFWLVDFFQTLKEQITNEINLKDIEVKTENLENNFVRFSVFQNKVELYSIDLFFGDWLLQIQTMQSSINNLFESISNFIFMANVKNQDFEIKHLLQAAQIVLATRNTSKKKVKVLS